MEFSILLFITSFLAGILTVFAPCIFTFLPVVLGSSNTDSKARYTKAIVIVLSLGLSVFIFSLLLRASTELIEVPQSTWDLFAGLIIYIQGIIVLIPEIWDKISYKIGLSKATNNLQKAQNHKGVFGDVLTGSALGPIFSSCSPTYGFIIGALIQSSFSISLSYLIIYIIGLCIMLFTVAVLGQRFVQKLKWGVNPHGVFKRIVALIFITLGLLIMTGAYKDIETFIINELPFLDVTRIDRELLKNSIE